MSPQRSPLLYQRIRQILESARSTAARSVNTTQVVANWLIGREIVEEEQKGKKKAEYGDVLLEELSGFLTADYGPGYSGTNLRWFRQFYLEYQSLLPVRIYHALRDEFTEGSSQKQILIYHALSDDLSRASSNAAPAEPLGSVISDASNRKSWKPGVLHPKLSWTHYRTLLRVDKPEARSFYEIEAIKNNWAAREMERQINSLLYERLALSRDKKGLMRLALKGHEVQKPADVFKDPTVMEFLDLPESPRLVESDLERALIDNLQTFLLELGKGFAFVARQKRLTLDGDHFYIDLVFYHTILKCYVIIDLKTGKLMHQDLGQLQLYVNYYDRECRTQGDGPTLGLILCVDKNDAVVRYTLGEDQQKKIFASRYKLHLPTEAELKAEIRRELRALPQKGGAK
jgi:predicted nuclease of restriction endonuclease-like (RecB) superfamily